MNEKLKEFKKIKLKDFKNHKKITLDNFMNYVNNYFAKKI